MFGVWILLSAFAFWCCTRNFDKVNSTGKILEIKMNWDCMIALLLQFMSSIPFQPIMPSHAAEGNPNIPLTAKSDEIATLRRGMRKRETRVELFTVAKHIWRVKKPTGGNKHLTTCNWRLSRTSLNHTKSFALKARWDCHLRKQKWKISQLFGSHLHWSSFTSKFHFRPPTRLVV